MLLLLVLLTSSLVAEAVTAESRGAHIVAPSRSAVEALAAPAKSAPTALVAVRPDELRALEERISARLDWIGQFVTLPDPIDSDADGWPDFQDNCPFAANAGQEDFGGVGSGSPSDGIGNACQCGDVTGDGYVTGSDATFIKRWALGLSAPLFLVPGNCDVTGEGNCTGSDGTFVKLAALGFTAPLFGQNCENALPQ